MKKFWLSRTVVLALALIVSIGSITGGTIAWFTDSVESTNNVITAGNLDIQLLDGEDEVTKDTKLFDYKLWEPGYTTHKTLTIKNAGNLALKYTFGINPDSIPADAKLADVIDVYVFETAPTSRDQITDGNLIGTLRSLASAEKNVFTGSLKKGESHSKVVLLKMQESAGNEYQNLQLNNIGISLLATQDTVEEDAFDNQYDKDATYDDNLDNTVGINTVEDLEYVLNNNKSGKLLRDISVTEQYFTVPNGITSIIDLNGYTITATDFIINNGNLTIKGEGGITVKQINNNAALTLGSGVVLNTSGSLNAVLNGEDGTLVINGATINHSGSDYAIQNEGTTTIDNADITSATGVIENVMGTTTINGGTFTHNGSMRSVIQQMYDGGTIINGGTFIQNGDDPLANVEYGGNLTVNGGTFDATSMFIGYVFEATVTVNAGEFKNNATVVDYFSDFNSLVPATSTATTNADGSITVTVNE